MFRTKSIATATLAGFLRVGKSRVRSTRALRLTLSAVALSLLTSWTAYSQGTRTFSLVHTFGSEPEEYPMNLIQDRAGNLYGTTLSGGDLTCPHETAGCGTVFKLDPATGTITTLYAFTGISGSGKDPVGLVQDLKGNLYGANSDGGVFGYGVVFRLSPEGVVTILHSFADRADGGGPIGKLVGDAAGNLYGVTYDGGMSPTCCGVVFRIDPTRAYTVLHTFARSSNDGSQPQGPLTLDAAGNLYGTTTRGGSNDSGTVFKLDPAGAMTILYNFDFSQGGYSPQSGVVQDGAGNLYGTAYSGGANGGGTLFKLDAAGNFTLLHSFSGGAAGESDGNTAPVCCDG